MKDNESIRQLLYYFRQDQGLLESDIAYDLNIPQQMLQSFLYEGVSVNDKTLRRICTYLEDKYRERDESQAHLLKGLYDDDEDYEIQPEARKDVRRRLSIHAEPPTGRSDKRITS
jgi:hypothetical protein